MAVGRYLAGLIGTALVLTLAMGCAGRRISKVGQLSEKPILSIVVGTTIEVRFPTIEFEDEKGDATTGTIH